MCPQWRTSFEQFLADLGPKPSPEQWLSRKDLTKGFEPGNVIWETREAWGVLKDKLASLELSREELQRLSAQAKALGMRVGHLRKLLALGLTTKELLLAPLPPSISTPPPDR